MLKRLVLVVALVAALAVPAAGSAAPPAQAMFTWSYWYPNSPYYGYLLLYDGTYSVYNSSNGAYDEGQWQVFAQKQLRFFSESACYGAVGVYQWKTNPFIGVLSLQRVSDSCAQRVAALTGTVWRR